VGKQAWQLSPGAKMQTTAMSLWALLPASQVKPTMLALFLTMDFQSQRINVLVGIISK
jgi:hypothetical protein